MFYSSTTLNLVGKNNFHYLFSCLEPSLNQSRVRMTHLFWGKRHYTMSDLTRHSVSNLFTTRSLLTMRKLFKDGWLIFVILVYIDLSNDSVLTSCRTRLLRNFCLPAEYLSTFMHFIFDKEELRFYCNSFWKTQHQSPRSNTAFFN